MASYLLALYLLINISMRIKEIISENWANNADLGAYTERPQDQRLMEKPKSDPCWKGYKQLGMKKKGGKKVPNCVPTKENIGGAVGQDQAISGWGNSPVGNYSVKTRSTSF